MNAVAALGIVPAWWMFLSACAVIITRFAVLPINEMGHAKISAAEARFGSGVGTWSDISHDRRKTFSTFSSRFDDMFNFLQDSLKSLLGRDFAA
mmetsp:Transcript_31617/g.64260  ORF Transcript_31617/g.64260 Transcript_31617/m.64260 type:complete len:94 (-) Transcript_31617:46-327(-)